MMASTRLILICAVIALASIPVRAQSSAPVSAAATQPSAVAPDVSETTEPSPEPVGFTYKPDGRRDPFVSLARRGADTRLGADGLRPAGLAGLATGELTLRGTLRSRDGFVAMLEGSDQKTYIVRPGDKLFDGTISSISQNDLVILQQVDDPLSLEKQREVRKGLRQVEAN
jgi:Tfp pilus assembly protein PilP